MADTLVIQPLPGIGDMVWHLPHLTAIAQASPGGTVTVLTKRRSRADEMFAGSSLVERVLWLERGQHGHPRGRHDGLFGAWRLANDLRVHRFDTVWVLHDSPRYALAARLARIPTRIGFGSGRQRRFLTDPRMLPHSDRHKPASEKADTLLVLHGLTVEPTPHFEAAPEAVRRIAAAFADRPRPWIGLGVGSSEPFKQWGAGRFARLAATLATTGGTVFAIGGPDEGEAIASIQAASDAVEPAVGLPLGDAAALASACDVVIGNDTGFLNLAAATGVATIGLFGGSPPLTQYPNLLALEPPGGGVYRLDRMAEIPVEAAAGAVRESLDAGHVRAVR